MRFFSSIRTKFALAYTLMISVVLLFMNTYFLIASRDMIFTSKLAFVQNQALILETALRDFEKLTIDNVGQVISRLNMNELAHITVVDARGRVLYDTLESPGALGASFASGAAFFDEYVPQALAGNDVLDVSFSGGAFVAGAIVPIMRSGMVTGAVYLYELDPSQGAILLGLQSAMRQITAVIVTLSVLLIVYILWTVMRRITSILRAIESVRAGEYTYRIRMSGNDELAMLGDEFNSLTGRLRETEDLRRRFVADASHELKTPLASIRLLADSILQNENMDGGTLRDFVADIGGEAERLARTTEKLMTLTRVDSGVREESVPVDLREAVTATLKMLSMLFEREGLTLTTELAAGCDVLASRDAIHGIVFNLVENALKYNTPGGSVSVRLERGYSRVLLTVEDTGIGVPEEDLPHIFDRFYRVDKARSRAAGGSGLGLSIVRDTVLTYDGEITASRRAGGGMAFVVRFPRWEARTGGEDA
ncbi:MAG: HAMP domain-containing histidine kinase [Oscillospiraceae bacterium]|nr:HAMP domain-containing histidine kinase [Oscillospiraceae bacterium]